MDADSPDLIAYQKIAKQYGAYLLIDCAHDFGHIGPNGKGTSVNIQVPGKCRGSRIFLTSSCVERAASALAQTSAL